MAKALTTRPSYTVERQLEEDEEEQVEEGTRGKATGVADEDPTRGHEKFRGVGSTRRKVDSLNMNTGRRDKASLGSKQLVDVSSNALRGSISVARVIVAGG